jgi:uncharacterized damage-inducible protein DinB
MSEIRRILDQITRAHERMAWHGPALREVLDGVTAGTAAARPMPAAHSIWEIVLHLATWESVVRRRLRGERFEPGPAEDWPAVGETDTRAWEAALRALFAGNLALREAIARYDEARLDLAPDGGQQSAYVLMHGAIQHALYHAGQIAILRKAAPR